jgi:hypothetical protein
MIKKIYWRSIVKGLVWEILGIIVLLLLTSSVKISFVYFNIRVVMYYIYHWLWKKTEWGKKKCHT